MTADAENKVTYKEIAPTILLKLLPLSLAVVVVFKFVQHLLLQNGITISSSVQNGALLITLLLSLKISAGKMLRRLFAEEFEDRNGDDEGPK
ncbi:MAG: hypothetical protein ACREPV_06425 [Lysobacter sp.]